MEYGGGHLMAIDFPNTPNTNDTYTVNGRTWLYDGEKWVILNQANTFNNQVYDIMLLNKMETN
jgi:hypothetical protein